MTFPPSALTLTLMAGVAVGMTMVASRPSLLADSATPRRDFLPSKRRHRNFADPLVRFAMQLYAPSAGKRKDRLEIFALEVDIVA